MKKLTIFFLFFISCILTHSSLSLSYASMGLKLWFEKMVPALLPFMILSGIMVRMNLTEKIAMIIYPIIYPLYRINKKICYCMLMGFLCGFPMGAKVVADLYGRKEINRREAEYLLSFCNNIGPVYFCSYALPLLHITESLPYLFGMYGIPMLYGLIIRYTRYREINSSSALSPKKSGANDLHNPIHLHTGEKLLCALEDSIQASLQSILILGGYMILFNLLNLLPHLLFQRNIPLLSPLFEITGGLQLLKQELPIYSLVILSFGGFSCLAQTYSCISKTDLSIGNYIKHKCILTVLVAIYYLLLFLRFIRINA